MSFIKKEESGSLTVSTKLELVFFVIIDHLAVRIPSDFQKKDISENSKLYT